MTIADIISLRIHNQQLANSSYKTAADVTRWMGAIQAQDYGAAKWALGLRIPGSTDAIIDKAFNDGKLLRTHVMRPTWHFVTPEDIGWIIELTASRVNAQCAFMNRKMELDDKLFARCNKIIERALKDSNYLTRPELGSIIEKAGIAVNELRLTCIMMRAELDAIVCSGPRKGKQFTYALLSERAPKAKALKKNDALAELAARYFTSHGPATIDDFVWWSGLTKVDAKTGAEAVKPKLLQETVDGQTYWYKDGDKVTNAISVYLLPNYDEYTVAYKDRSALLDTKIDARGGIIFSNVIVENGQVTGSWKRTIKKDAVLIEPIIFIKPTKARKSLISEAAERYAVFHELRVAINW